MEAGRVELDRCTFIRWKGMFIDVQRDDIPGDPNDPNSGHICWCLHTQNCLGPDGQVVAEDYCNSFRGCFKEL